jgi:hypothetical protein
MCYVDYAEIVDEETGEEVEWVEALPAAAAPKKLEIGNRAGVSLASLVCLGPRLKGGG